MQSLIRKSMMAGAGVVAIAGALTGCGQSKAPDQAAAPAAAPAPAIAAPVVAASAPPSAATAPPAFAVCAACHSVIAGQTLVGPSLAGVYGRAAASAPGYPYSDAVKALHVTWDEASLDKWLTNPTAMAPGTRMAYAGIPDAGQRQVVIAYLKTLK